MTEKRYDLIIKGVWDNIEDYELSWNEIVDLLNENEQLKETNQELYDKLQETMSSKSLKMGENSILKKENEQLKKRNNNQYHQLQHLWSLMEKQDWETLTEMVEQMHKDEKRLQNEWKCYE